MLFLIAAPAEANDLHVQVLAELATLFLDTDFCASLRQSETPEAFCRAIARREAQDDPAVPRRRPPRAGLPAAGCDGLPHRHCPHLPGGRGLTAGRQTRGLTIKVETNGAGGVGNELTEDEIQAADCIIVAVDRSISLARLLGKRLVYTSAGEAVRNADALLEMAVSGKASIYRGGHAFRTNDWKELGREYYGHLMSGISHMLPFVVAGGVMLALSLLLQHLGGPANWSTMMTNVGNAALSMMYPILSAFIAYSIADPARPDARPDGRLPGPDRHDNGHQTQLDPQRVLGGGLIAGFAAGLVVRLLNRLFRRIPQDLDHIKTGLLVPLLSLLFVGWLMLMVVNPPLGRFNRWMSLALAKLQGGSRLVLGAVLGALMATDYGGPINKAAYVTGTLAVTNSQYDLMAAVMAGGMIPPLGLALACLLFPTRFTKAERRTVPQNLVMGASFVTEGALPFALRDPLRVVPSCMAGSALAGFLTVLFGCGCPAPHGGLFLLAVIGNPLGFLAALAAGSLLTTLLVGMLKKPVKS